MSAMTLTRSCQPTDAAQFVTQAGPATEQPVLPPTLRARQAPAERLQAAHRLARLAINLAAEQLPPEQAETSVIAAADRQPDLLDLAADYLAYSHLADNLSDHVTALFMVEHARNALAEVRDRRLAGWPARIFRRLAGMRVGGTAAHEAA